MIIVGYAEIDGVQYAVQMIKGYIYLANDQINAKHKFTTFDMLKAKLLMLQKGGSKVKIWFTVGKENQ